MIGKSVKTTARFRETLYQQIEAIAQREQVSLNSVLVEAAKAYVASKDRGAKKRQAG